MGHVREGRALPVEVAAPFGTGRRKVTGSFCSPWLRKWRLRNASTLEVSRELSGRHSGFLAFRARLLPISIPRPQLPYARVIPVQDRATLSVCRPYLHAAAIQPSQMRRADQKCVLPTGRSCSTAKGTPPRSLKNYLTHSIRRRAKSERGSPHAVGDSVTTGDQRAWISRPILAHQIETPTWPIAPGVP